jgi:rubrerythrin
MLGRMERTIMMDLLRTLISLALPAAAVVAGSKAAEAPGNTLENLQAAFNGESNARARYLAFAEKADQEGYGQAASLFRAAARAEQIHAANHAVVITEMGAAPKATIEPPVVKSTRENLEAAIAGETYERDVMYPGFIAVAKQEKNSAALRTFNYALKVEAEHAALYSDALNNLAQFTTRTSYYVCSVCGFTTKTLSFLKCIVCGIGKEKFEQVS